MKHEYTFEELAELRKIYNESGEGGLEPDEMRALRKAGLLTQGLPEKPSKRDCILAHCKKRISQGQPFDGKETAEALGMSQKTVGNILSQLRKEGLLPAFDKHSPRKTTRKTTTTGKKKETMTTTSKITADKITATKLTPVGTIIVGPQATADPHHHRKRLGRHLRRGERLATHSIPSQRQSGLRIRHETPQRRTHGLEGQLQQGCGEMRLKFNSKDGVFTVKPENEEEKTALKTSAPAICDLIIDFFDAEVQEMKVAKE